MTAPYSPPNAELRAEAPARVEHGVCAFVSSAVVLLLVWDASLISRGRSPFSVGWLVSLRAIALILAASAISGGLLLLVRRLQWYWAILAGPFVAAAVIFCAAVGYFLAFVYRG